MLDLEFAEFSDTGPSRDQNEDYCGSYQPATPEEAEARGWCFAVADGVGGQAGGEIASRIAIETLLTGLPSISSSEALTVALPRLIQRANQRVFEAAGSGLPAGSIATTIVACAIRYDRAVVAHVGDSRAYLIRRGRVTGLTRDHTIANEQLGRGILSARQAAAATTANLLSRSLGNEMFVSVDTGDHLLIPGDTLLLCSDGLHRSVAPADMTGILSPSVELESAAAELVALANARDGSDNVSVQLIRIRAVESVGMYRGRLYKLPKMPIP
ncbi:Serine/threonine phosphatase PPP [Acidisarcina polymorpha]|uniref:Serine/threonine phosphatase PPP n=1 Tax=Acidisarcina polymorpha TaxID=2211140 RepID=A0A2Z5G057_9BACT|nr:protein phosphatase 2C domain-containing protein [Acidisarcina polymorpha]AXC12508.1 Serine/threonine phosphatase PPP [Acidisarcina polymorpha]